VTLPATSVSLDGSLSDDGLPAGTTTAAWAVVSAPGPVTFASHTSPATTAQLSSTGTYVFRLSASDGELQASDDVTVVLEPANAPPVVSAGPDQRVLGLSTTLVGSVSDDGKPLAWSLTSAWSASSAGRRGSLRRCASAATTATFGAPGNTAATDRHGR
jgi:hypothetical protein